MQKSNLLHAFSVLGLDQQEVHTDFVDVDEIDDVQAIKTLVTTLLKDVHNSLSYEFVRALMTNANTL